MDIGATDVLREKGATERDRDRPQSGEVATSAMHQMRGLALVTSRAPSISDFCGSRGVGRTQEKALRESTSSLERRSAATENDGEAAVGDSRAEASLKDREASATPTEC